MATDPSQIRPLLDDLARGDGAAAGRLLPLVYDDLRAIAAGLLRQQPPSHTLQPTALCNEACIRLLGSSADSWNGKEHLLAVAAIAMRQILVSHAVAKSTLKRGGGVDRATLIDVADHREAPSVVDVLALESTLVQLEAEDPDLARVVELRYFAGMTVQQVALVMGQSERTVNRLWRTARAELATRLSPPEDAR
ncbi:MAG: ECF-type sigma factor [Phycisphaerales bacterium]